MYSSYIFCVCNTDTTKVKYLINIIMYKNLYWWVGFALAVHQYLSLLIQAYLYLHTYAVFYLLQICRHTNYTNLVMILWYWNTKLIKSITPTPLCILMVVVESFWHNVPRWLICGSSIFRITEVNTIYMQSSHAVKIYQMPIFQHSIMNHTSGS